MKIKRIIILIIMKMLRVRVTLMTKKRKIKNSFSISEVSKKLIKFWKNNEKKQKIFIIH